MFGLMIAAVLSTMILMASPLGAGNLPSAGIREYRAALQHQLSIWFGLLVVFTIVGGMFQWTLPLLLPERLQPYMRTSYDLAHLLVGLIVFCLASIPTRTPQVARGIRSLLDLSANIATKRASWALRAIANLTLPADRQAYRHVNC